MLPAGENKQTNKQTKNYFVLSQWFNIFHLQVILCFGVVYKHQQKFANKVHSHTICIHMIRPEVKRVSFCFSSCRKYLTKVQMQKISLQFNLNLLSSWYLFYKFLCSVIYRLQRTTHKCSWTFAFYLLCYLQYTYDVEISPLVIVYWRNSGGYNRKTSSIQLVYQNQCSRLK